MTNPNTHKLHSWYGFECPQNGQLMSTCVNGIWVTTCFVHHMNSSENGARQNPSENQVVHHFPSQNSQTHCSYTGIYRVHFKGRATAGPPSATKLPPWAWSGSPSLAPWQALVQWLVDFGRVSVCSCPRTVQWRKMWRRFSWKCPHCHEILMQISTHFYPQGIAICSGAKWWEAMESPFVRFRQAHRFESRKTLGIQNDHGIGPEQYRVWMSMVYDRYVFENTPATITRSWGDQSGKSETEWYNTVVLRFRTLSILYDYMIVHDYIPEINSPECIWRNHTQSTVICDQTWHTVFKKGAHGTPSARIFFNAQVLEIVDIGHLKKGVGWCQGSHSRHSRAECTRRRRSLKWSHRHHPPRKSGHSTVCQTPMGTAKCVITKGICCGSFLTSFAKFCPAGLSDQGDDEI